jgi:hypothetical protein
MASRALPKLLNCCLDGNFGAGGGRGGISGGPRLRGLAWAVVVAAVLVLATPVWAQMAEDLNRQELNQILASPRTTPAMTMAVAPGATMQADHPQAGYPQAAYPYPYPYPNQYYGSGYDYTKYGYGYPYPHAYDTYYSLTYAYYPYAYYPYTYYPLGPHGIGYY